MQRKDYPESQEIRKLYNSSSEARKQPLLTGCAGDPYDRVDDAVALIDAVEVEVAVDVDVFVAVGVIPKLEVDEPVDVPVVVDDAVRVNDAVVVNDALLVEVDVREAVPSKGTLARMDSQRTPTMP